MTPERKTEIRGAADTIQWGRDSDAAAMMIESLDAVDELEALLRLGRTGGMDVERVRAIATFYGAYLTSGTLDTMRKHLIGMVPRLHALLDEGRVEKAMRWLGFMQGALWAEGVFTLDELKEHSRPDAPAPIYSSSSSSGSVSSSKSAP